MFNEHSVWLVTDYFEPNFETIETIETELEANTRPLVLDELRVYVH
jgi:hypothetical protein